MSVSSSSGVSGCRRRAPARGPRGRQRPLFGSGSLGRPEGALTDDVALDLIGAAVDRRRGREHERLPRNARRSGPSGSHNVASGPRMSQPISAESFVMRVWASLPTFGEPGTAALRPSVTDRLAVHSPVREHSTSRASFWRISGSADAPGTGAPARRAPRWSRPCPTLGPAAGAARRRPPGARGIRPLGPGGGKLAIVPPAPIPMRSKRSVVFATAHPLFSPPIRSASATTASSKNTSLKSAWPVISPAGGWSRRAGRPGTRTTRSPRASATSRSVRASSIP